MGQLQSQGWILRGIVRPQGVVRSSRRDVSSSRAKLSFLGLWDRSLGPTANRSPHAGHSIRSKSMRRTSGRGNQLSTFWAYRIERRPHFFEIYLARSWHGSGDSKSSPGVENRGIVGGKF
jgi:hypothetical protein